MTALEVVKASVEAFNRGDLDTALACYDDAVRLRSPDPDGEGLRERRGKEELRRVFMADREHAVTFKYSRFVCQGNAVAAEADNVGCFGNKTISQPVAVFYEVVDEKIVSVTVYYDRLGLKKALERA
jgi:ketosteroid isomerase-like protein